MRVDRRDAQVTGRPGGSRRSTGAAGRTPRARKAAPSRTNRTRAAPPSRAGLSDQPTTDRAKRVQVTARASVLAAALVTVTLALAPALKDWLAQRDQIAALSARNAAARQHLTELQHQRQEWNSPDFIEKQARERLHMGMRGQTVYELLGGKHASGHALHPHVTSNRAWYDQLWSSAQKIGT